MIAAAEHEVSEDQVLDLVGAIRFVDPAIAPVGAGLMTALHLGIAKDSRTFARLFGIAHALVLREITALTEYHLLTIVGRNARTQRTEIALTEAGERIMTRALHA